MQEQNANGSKYDGAATSNGKMLLIDGVTKEDLAGYAHGAFTPTSSLP